VDIVEIDETAHRRRADILRRLQAALVRALAHHHELAHAAARRPMAHFFLEAKRASEELERGGHVAIEEIRDDLRRPGGGRHGDLLVRYAQPACALLLPPGEGYAHFSFV